MQGYVRIYFRGDGGSFDASIVSESYAGIIVRTKINERYFIPFSSIHMLQWLEMDFAEVKKEVV